MNTTDISIVAIDPGTDKWGWAQFVNGKYHDSGFVKLDTKKPRSQRLGVVYKELCKIFRTRKPDGIAYELPVDFHSSITALSEFIGVLRLAAHTARRGISIPVFDVAPTTAKKAVLGAAHRGSMQKEKVLNALEQILGRKFKEDEADAISIGMGFYIHDGFFER